MEKCLYQGKLIYALDVRKDYSFHKSIKHASADKQLKCAGCGAFVSFKEYNDRSDHFSHRIGEKTDCDYIRYEQSTKKRSHYWKELKNNLFEYFRQTMDVEMDVKLIDKHWTDLCLTLPNQSKHALDIIDVNMNIKTMEAIKNSYEEKQIPVTWFILDQLSQISNEMYLPIMKRIQLHESRHLLVVDKMDLSLAVYQYDANTYPYKNREGYHQFSTDIFEYRFELSQIKCVGQEMEIAGFKENYEKWMNERQLQFLTHDKIVEKKMKKEVYQREISTKSNKKREIKPQDILYLISKIKDDNLSAKNKLIEKMNDQNYIKMLKQLQQLSDLDESSKIIIHNLLSIYAK